MLKQVSQIIAENNLVHCYSACYQIVKMVTSGWLGVALSYKVVWRCATVVCGGLCVMISGEGQMQL